MRYLTTALLAICSLGATAQDNTSTDGEKISVLPKQRKHEAGMIFNLALGNTSTGTGAGIQYKYWANPNHAIRVNALYNPYSYSNGRIYSRGNGDTLLSKLALTDIPTVQGGIGIEKQRHFYKSVYLYAALDLYAAYGSGTTKEWMEDEITKDNVTYRQNHRAGASYNSTIFRAGILPMIGAKYQFSRVTIGTEFSGLRMEYNNVTHGAGGPKSSGIADFNMGEFTQRIFVNFRF